VILCINIRPWIPDICEKMPPPPSSYLTICDLAVTLTLKSSQLIVVPCKFREMSTSS